MKIEDITLNQFVVSCQSIDPNFPSLEYIKNKKPEITTPEQLVNAMEYEFKQFFVQAIKNCIGEEK